ncbi:MAG: mobile mystery protein B [Rhodospirillales bacterium]|nr:mobile mystery protein B [Rhodospirillales bacterium]
MSPDADGAAGATPLDPDERNGLKHRHITTRGELDQLEQANIAGGLAWLARRRKTDILTEAFMRELHRRLFGDVWRWAGTFRLTEKNIGIDPLDIPVQLRMLLGDARYWAEHRSFAPLEAAARFHHRLVQIHPFPNGNGRHARIAADVYLEECFGHGPVDWTAGYSLQSMNERRAQYIDALRAADAGDFEPLLAFVGL